MAEISPLRRRMIEDMTVRNLSPATLRFFYGVTLGQDTVPERITYARQPSKLPVVLSALSRASAQQRAGGLAQNSAPPPPKPRGGPSALAG